MFAVTNKINAVDTMAPESLAFNRADIQAVEIFSGKNRSLNMRREDNLSSWQEAKQISMPRNKDYRQHTSKYALLNPLKGKQEQMCQANSLNLQQAK